MKNENFNLEKKTENLYYVYYYNNVKMGEIYREVDGFFVYVPENRPGYVEAHQLRYIADTLDELNKEWTDIINEECRGN